MEQTTNMEPGRFGTPHPLFGTTSPTIWDSQTASTPSRKIWRHIYFDWNIVNKALRGTPNRRYTKNPYHIISYSLLMCIWPPCLFLNIVLKYYGATAISLKTDGTQSWHLEQLCACPIKNVYITIYLQKPLIMQATLLWINNRIREGSCLQGTRLTNWISDGLQSVVTQRQYLIRILIVLVAALFFTSTAALFRINILIKTIWSSPVMSVVVHYQARSVPL